MHRPEPRKSGSKPYKIPSSSSKCQQREQGNLQIADDAWVNKWLDEPAVAEKGAECAAARSVKLGEYMQTLLKAKEIRESLEQLTESQTGSERHDPELAENLEQRVHAEREELRSLLAKVTNKDVLRNVKYRLGKLRRKKRWQEKRQKTLREIREERLRNRERLHEETDLWLARRRAEEAQLLDDAEHAKQLEQKIKDARIAKRKHEDIVSLLQALERLRNLRRDKAKKAGEVFPEEDDEFFRMVEEQSTATVGGDEHESTPQEDEEAPSIRIVRPSGFEVRDIDDLIRVRRQWDNYIVPAGTPGGSRVPQHFVIPGPPSNEDWAGFVTGGS
ncbi:uncharacterized protein SPPG_02505 [Spizellomyces punctatus DAOM BR117]|uniref:Programmed cell death protein 7 n=1 Tax=Spizellomyces punctatus (strain DAOM BR117) TaxID=645134 RepID=A0A0L0HME8_SPIPD|nr:uncharacterized protein SPPG_02505 [Spizellomyces punctatus DAOM BR117]KND01999.1 hypothetical protein SPPG_02505 [Spizellomyces punctatus DAOM BR117]|eukprot:XP_016610038.1 hypothetical protein SPPG_02505 [Spizellomyces punctatus DAOM BR117]